MSHVKQCQPTETVKLNHILASEARLNRLHRLFKTHFNVTEPSIIIEPYLFLGNCISAHDTNRLSKLGIRYILNVAIRDVELCPYYSSEIRTLTIDLRDDDRENIIRTFDQAFNFIDEAKQNKSRVLVHCSHGQSRSPAIVIAYLMRTYSVSLEQCLAHVVKARPCVLPNDGFLKQLILFDLFLAERQRKRQEAAATAAAKEAANIPVTTEIPIQYKPSESPQTSESSVAKTSTSIKRPPIEASHTQNRSTPVSPTLEKPLNLESVTSNDSIHFIPIQVPTKRSRSKKVKQIQIKKVPVKNKTIIPEMTKTIENSKEKVIKMDAEITPVVSTLELRSSSRGRSSKKCPSAYIASVVREITSPTRRSHSTYSDLVEMNHYDYYAPSSMNQEWDDFNSYYRSGRRSQEPPRTKYITEIYDKATNRFIRTTC